MKKSTIFGIGAILLTGAVASKALASFKDNLSNFGMIQTDSRFCLEKLVKSADFSFEDRFGLERFGNVNLPKVYSYEVFLKSKFQPYGPEAAEVILTNNVISSVGQEVIEGNKGLGGLIFSFEDYAEALLDTRSRAAYEVGIKARAFNSYSEESARRMLPDRLRKEYEAMFSKIDLDGNNLVPEGSKFKNNAEVLVYEFNYVRDELSKSMGYEVNSLRDSKGCGSGNKVLYFLNRIYSEEIERNLKL